ncbi:MAG: tRNA (adenosine(37)-N6)-threonylcarbamoyltransferase complex transferase subunit TsaD [Clostridiales bacterium]|jgi:N6-L-threonylcarbamoyladenine synthase|nr:tRNA (adenosine(37)-N6)-threonylcarbamoyltransferase complex transferase subunit TsaD [Clostridiales bacterium]
MLILGIETSCDETAAAVVRDGRYVLSNIIASQIDVHREYGGVVPEIASRKHIENIGRVVDTALREADTDKRQIDAVAVTSGPGLVGALLVGLSYGKALSFALNKPLIGVNHIEGHICANLLGENPVSPPFICLVVSGGHTHLLRVSDNWKIEVLGRTRDDAAGEAFDKTARALGLPYPGGPSIDLLAKQGNPNAIPFPRALSDEAGFSFSGLKSAVLNYLNKQRMMGEAFSQADVAASFQKAVVDVLTDKAIAACMKLNINTLALAGGVASNSALRKSMRMSCEKNGITLFVPPPIYCTDNAAMIASRGYFRWKQGKISSLDLNANPDVGDFSEM